MKTTWIALITLGSLSLIAQNVPLSKIQVIGSHNSYKKVMDEKLYQHLLQKDTGVSTLYYDHPSIEKQLNLGLRNLEIDIWKDDNGGKYANPSGAKIANKTYEWQSEMKTPGFKIFHMPDVDYETHQPNFEKQLRELKKWSEQNLTHETVFITLELKDEKEDKETSFTYQDIEAINQQIQDNLGAEHLITPKELKRQNNQIIWPSIDQSRGKFVWIIDNTDYRRELFDKIEIEQSNIFLNVAIDHPKAGCMILNNPYDETIPQLAEKGIIIRTRADDSTKQARNNDYSTFEQAKKSKAQIITTDYYIPSELFPSTYKVIFDDNTYVRVQE